VNKPARSKPNCLWAKWFSWRRGFRPDLNIDFGMAGPEQGCYFGLLSMVLSARQDLSTSCTVMS